MKNFLFLIISKENEEIKNFQIILENKDYICRICEREINLKIFKSHSKICKQVEELKEKLTKTLIKIDDETDGIKLWQRKFKIILNSQRFKIQIINFFYYLIEKKIFILKEEEEIFSNPLVLSRNLSLIKFL